jgi:hypothetical protein
MPASLPGDNTLNNFGNPNAGNFVIFDALSGPKGSPFDNDGSPPTTISTGALSTGIGFGSPPVIGLTAPASISAMGFTDDYKPGISTPTPADSANSTIMYIGGGKCTKNVDGNAPVVPYTAGFGICGAGNGGSRDSGLNTGFGLKMVTATGAVANGAAVEAGWTNRSGVALVTGQSVFGSATVALAAAA